MEPSPSIYTRLIAGFNFIFTLLFGKFSWNSPLWIKQLKERLYALFRPNLWKGIGR